MNEQIIVPKLKSTNVRFVKRGHRYAILDFLWKYTPFLAKFLVRNIFFSPASYALSPIEKKYLASATSFEITANKRTIKCWKWGRGPGILLVHGWNGRGIQLNRLIDPLVNSGASVLTFDGPGHGESQGRTSSYFEFSDVIRSLLRNKRLNIKGAVAHSLGASALLNGMIKEKYSLKAVLISPALKLAETLKNIFREHGIPEALYNNLIREYEEKFGYNLQKDNPFNLLSELKSNILIIHDTTDEIIPYLDSLEASHRFPFITLYTTRELGHKGILSDSATVAFISEQLIQIFPEKSLNPSEEQKEKMKLSSEIIKEYWASNFEKRLCLFLEHPPFRNDFIAVEQGEKLPPSDRSSFER